MKSFASFVLVVSFLCVIGSAYESIVQCEDTAACYVCLDTPGVCDQCKEGYRNIKGRCIKCEIQNCSLCDRATFICDKCALRSFFKDEKCVKCINNCLVCQNAAYCLTCEPGYRFEGCRKI